MPHKTRAEQRAFKVRKDPNKRALPTRIHKVDVQLGPDDADIIREGLYDWYGDFDDEQSKESSD